MFVRKKKIHQLSLAEGQVEKILKPDDTTLFISYSQKRAKKDAFNREKGLKRWKKTSKQADSHSYRSRSIV